MSWNIVVGVTCSTLTVNKSPHIRNADISKSPYTKEDYGRPCYERYNPDYMLHWRAKSSSEYSLMCTRQSMGMKCGLPSQTTEKNPPNHQFTPLLTRVDEVVGRQGCGMWNARFE